MRLERGRRLMGRLWLREQGNLYFLISVAVARLAIYAASYAADDTLGSVSGHL